MATILVVDDDQDIRQLLSLVLTEMGYAVQSAQHGQEALHLIEQMTPELILLDLRMPVMNGWEMARQLQARGSTVPLVVMTAAVDARQWAEEIDATGYLAKPFDLSVLLGTITRVLAN